MDILTTDSQAGDSLQRFVFEHAPIRGEIVHLDSTWRAVLDRRSYPPVICDLLGELMAAAALLAATIRFSGSLILQLQGKGPVKLVVVEFNSGGTMRGWAQCTDEIKSGPLQELIGKGNIVITIDPKDDKQRYQGIVSLEGETVAQALRNYLSRSEQLDTYLWLAADSERAAGMLLQKLPERPQKDEDAWRRAVRLGKTITRNELLDLPACEIVHRLYHEEDIRIFSRKPVSFRCSCSRNKVTAVLRMLGYDDVLNILHEHEQINVECEFCGQNYKFDRVDAEQLFASSVVAQPGQTRH